MAKNKGVIYIMDCISLPGIVKIGKTDTSQFDERMRKLETDGYRHEVLRRAYAIEVPDYDEKEKLLDRFFAKSRVGDSELFALPKDDAVELLKSFAGRQVYPKIDTKIFSTDEKHKRERRRGCFRFSMVGLSIGTEIRFDPVGFLVKVSSDNTVIYQGREYKLSRFVRDFMPLEKRNESGAYQGTLYFSYKGKTLQKMREECERQ